MTLAPRAHVYIAAMGRSGSTMLANLLTYQPHHWVMIEPWIPQGATGRNLLHQIRSFGWDVSDAEWRPREGETLEGRWDRLFRERLQELDGWGCKEVRSDLHRRTLDLVDPYHVIIMVRQLGEVVLSLLEKSTRQGTLDTHGPEWVAKYVEECASSLIEILERPVGDVEPLVVRYEDFTESEDYRQEIERRLGWRMRGSPDVNLEYFGRGFEISRHGDSISPQTISSSERCLPGGAVRLALELERKHRSYARAFNYAI